MNLCQSSAHNRCEGINHPGVRAPGGTSDENTQNASDDCGCKYLPIGLIALAVTSFLAFGAFCAVVRARGSWRKWRQSIAVERAVRLEETRRKNLLQNATPYRGGFPAVAPKARLSIWKLGSLAVIILMAAYNIYYMFH
jgi:hypothetical protein